MKVASVIAVLLLLALDAAALWGALAHPPGMDGFQPAILAAALALGIVTLVLILFGRRPARETGRATAEAARPAPAPPPAPVREDHAQAEVVSFLAALQEKGRLVDFLMDDINAHGDAEVGAAARVVHAGCRAVLQEHFRIGPVRPESEGSTVQIPAGYPADEYRLLGRISGQAPFTGVLIHRGWKTDSVTLPRLLRGSDERLPTIAPAEVELK